MSLTAVDLYKYSSKIRSEVIEPDDGIIRYYSDFAEDIFAISQDFENQYKRRAAIKSASAMFESSTFELWEQLKKNQNVSEAAKYILYEKTYTLADNGKIKVKKSIYTLKVRLRFALSQFNELNGEERKFILTEKLWNDLDSFLQVRNKLLHPDSLSIPRVSDDDLRLTMELGENMFTLLSMNMNANTIGMAARNNQNLTVHPLYSFYMIAEKNFITAKNYLVSKGILSI